jgi:cellulose synthase/poly-beta-1,6-N-acetylglucosamine synthase-like glycosyltransferase
MEWFFGFLCLVILYVIGWFYIHFFSLLKFKIPTPIGNSLSEASVIICLRGAENQFHKYFPLIAKQEDVIFEIIIVYKEISEEMRKYLQRIEVEYAHVKLVNLEEGIYPYKDKKQALNAGIAIAKYDKIVTIDADCYPENDLWLNQMISHFSPQVDCVLGVSPYVSQDSWTNRWIRFDAAIVALFYTAFATKGMAYMAVGRNMAFRKSLWNEAYLEKYKEFGFGDDDTLVQSIDDKKRVVVCFHPRVFSFPKLYFWQWIVQKMRHLAIGTVYPKEIIKYLAVYNLANFSFWMIIWLWMSYFSFHLIIFVFIFVYLFLRMMPIYYVERQMQIKNKTYKYVFFFDFLYMAFLIILPIFVKILPTRKWK